MPLDIEDPPKEDWLFLVGYWIFNPPLAGWQPLVEDALGAQQGDGCLYTLYAITIRYDLKYEFIKEYKPMCVIIVKITAVMIVEIDKMIASA